jgi:predicted ATP-grasp superfamily ATP-dependent carboligase
MLVLVTDGEDRAALASCRALARAGHTVDVAAGRQPAAAHSSRACARRLLVPRSTAGEEFVDGLASTPWITSYEALLPSSDSAVLAVSRFRERLPGSLLRGLPSQGDVARSLSKPALLAEADRTGFTALGTEQCANESEARAAASVFGFPVVVKPVMSIVLADGGAHREAARVVRNAAQLEDALSALGTPLLVQQFHPAAGVLSVGGVVSDNGLAALVAARWSRRWPPYDGAAAFAETVVAPSALVERVEVLLAALGWRGIFELELLELGHGRFAAIDFNPRPFGWMALALRAEVNLPAIWLDSLRGLDPAGVVARPGIRYRWEEGDLRHFVWQLRHGRTWAAAAVLRPRRHVAHAYFERGDPAPLATALVDLARRGARRTVTRRR